MNDESTLLRPAQTRLFPANCLDIARKLPGDFPDVARTAAAIAKSFANHRANFGADIQRRLLRCFPLTAGIRLGSCPDDSADITPDATPDAARTLRGRCSACGLIF